MRGAASLVLSSSLALPALAAAGLRGAAGVPPPPPPSPGARRGGPLADLIADAIRDAAGGGGLTAGDGGDGEGPAAKRRRVQVARTRGPRPTRRPTARPVTSAPMSAPTPAPAPGDGQREGQPAETAAETTAGSGGTGPTAGGPTEPPAGEPSARPETTAAATEPRTAYWHPSPSGDGCVYSSDYDPSMLAVHSATYPLLFKSEGGCCEVHCRRDDAAGDGPSGPTASTAAATAASTAAATAASTTSTSTAKPSYWYQASFGGGCVRSDGWHPSMLLANTTDHPLLFLEEGPCCEAHGCGGGGGDVPGGAEDGTVADGGGPGGRDAADPTAASRATAAASTAAASTAAASTTTKAPKEDGATIACPMNYRPVCGTDGRVYGNACVATAAGAIPDCELGTLGGAVPGGECRCPADGGPGPGPAATTEPAKPEPDPTEPATTDPTKPEPEPAEPEPEPTKPGPAACTREYAPVCGADSRVYGNACLAEEERKVEVLCWIDPVGARNPCSCASETTTEATTTEATTAAAATETTAKTTTAATTTPFLIPDSDPGAGGATVGPSVAPEDPAPPATSSSPPATSASPPATSSPPVPPRWYFAPLLEGRGSDPPACVLGDAYASSWISGHPDEFLFGTEAECCEAFDCAGGETGGTGPTVPGAMTDPTGTDMDPPTFPVAATDPTEADMGPTVPAAATDPTGPTMDPPTFPVAVTDPTVPPSTTEPTGPATETSGGGTVPATKAPDRWYPSALVEPGALGCEFGRAYVDTPGLAGRNYGTEDGCCAAWPVLCGGIQTTAAATAVPTSTTAAATTTAVPTYETLYWIPDQATDWADCVVGEPLDWMFPRYLYVFETRAGCCAGRACGEDADADADDDGDDDVGRWLANEAGTDCALAYFPRSAALDGAGWLFETRGGCCAAERCPDDGVPGTSAPSARPTSSPAAPGPTGQEGRWIANEAGGDCVLVDLPRSMLGAGWVYETRDGCCAAGVCPPDVVPGTSAPSSRPSAEPSPRPTPAPVTPSPTGREGRWIADEAGEDCVFANLPQSMLVASWVYETRDGCCAVSKCPSDDVPETSAPSSRPSAEPSPRPTSEPTPDPTSRPTAGPTSPPSGRPSPPPAASSRQDAPDRWYPRAFVESGAMGCEHGKAYADTLGLEGRNYDSNNECCAAWPELCYVTTSTTRSHYFKKWWPKAFDVPGASGCEFSTNYQYVPSVLPYLYISSTSCCDAWPDLCAESKYATTSTTTTSTAVWTPKKWYPRRYVDGDWGCAYDRDWRQYEVPTSELFISMGQCCKHTEDCVVN